MRRKRDNSTAPVRTSISQSPTRSKRRQQQQQQRRGWSDSRILAPAPSETVRESQWQTTRHTAPPGQLRTLRFQLHGAAAPCQCTSAHRHIARVIDRRRQLKPTDWPREAIKTLQPARTRLGKVSGAGRRCDDFPTNTTNFPQNFNRQLHIFDGKDCGCSKF